MASSGVVGVEINRVDGPRPWEVSVVEGSSEGLRVRIYAGAFAVARDAVARQDALMEKHDCPGWCTPEAAGVHNA